MYHICYCKSQSQQNRFYYQLWFVRCRYGLRAPGLSLLLGVGIFFGHHQNHGSNAIHLCLFCYVPCPKDLGVGFFNKFFYFKCIHEVKWMVEQWECWGDGREWVCGRRWELDKGTSGVMRVQGKWWTWGWFGWWAEWGWSTRRDGSWLCECDTLHRIRKLACLLCML